MVGVCLALAACAGGLLSGRSALDPATFATCRDPIGSEAWLRAQAALRLGDDEAALPDLIACTRRCPDLVRAHLAYQDCARRLGGDAEQAMVAFYIAAPERDSPVPAYLRARLSETAYAQNNSLGQILRAWPSFAWAHLSRARIHRSQGRLQLALDGYAQAIAHDRGLAEALLERAQVLAELGRDREAAVDYRAYLGQRPDDAAARHEYLALLLYRLGNLAQAQQELDRLGADGRDSIALRMDRAAAQWRSGQIELAVAGYVGVLRDAPATARAALNVGLLYYEVVPRNDRERRLYWPKARAAFRHFLATAVPSDGHEHFERTWAVPFRLARIDELLGPDGGPDQALASLDELAWVDAR